MKPNFISVVPSKYNSICSLCSHTDKDGCISFEEFTHYLTALSLLEDRKILNDLESPILTEQPPINLLKD